MLFHSVFILYNLIIYFNSDKMVNLVKEDIKMTFKDGWIKQMSDVLKMNSSSDINMSDDELSSALSSIYDEHVNSPNVSLVNNYKGFAVQCSLEEIFNIITSGNAILAGDGVLFQRHDRSLSDMVPVIIKYQQDRKKEKNLMKQYEKGTAEFLYHDRNQRNKKVVINALYGLFGYAKFRFFNINIAQSVTASGQLIISTATCCFENFLADNTKFILFDECILFINRMQSFYNSLPEEDKLSFMYLPDVTMENVVHRISEHSYSNYTADEATYIIDCLKNLSQDELKLIYYKNNLKTFNDTDYVHNLLQEIFDAIEHLQLGELTAFDSPEKFNTICQPNAKGLVEKLIHLYDVFVLDTHQIFDRVRRTKYTPKKSVMYIDTDSNFVALEEFVDYFTNTVHDKYNNMDSFIFKCTSILTIIVSHVVAETYTEFAKSMNIEMSYGSRIRMKNEFLFSILVFGTSKKRYFGKMIIQEGKLIKEGKGAIEIKGFDFKKAATKVEIYDKICKMLFDTILDVNQISYGDVLRSANEFKENIKKDILNGSNLYYKQLSVSTPDKYKNPYSMQGIKGVLLWNAIVDKQDRMEFPTEVDIIPIPFDKFSDKKFKEFLNNPKAFFEVNGRDPKYSALYNFYSNHSEQFTRMIITMTEHPDIWTKFPSSIAKPRAMTELPDWLKDIIDIDTIVHNNVNLINPILESVGIPIINEKLGPMFTTLVSL